MNGTAWSFVINGYSREYLEKHSVDWLKTHVTGIAQSADSEKLLDLISYSHEDDTVDTTFSVRQSVIVTVTICSSAPQGAVSSLAMIRPLKNLLT